MSVPAPAPPTAPSQRRPNSQVKRAPPPSITATSQQPTAKSPLSVSGVGTPKQDSRNGDRDRATKRVKVAGFAEARAAVTNSNSKDDGENGASNSGKEEGGKRLSRGEEWLLYQITLMENQYKDVLLAAAAIVQYQTYALRFGRKKQPLPIHLDQKLKYAYAAYQATHRQTQRYMNDAAQHAATPSHPVVVPTPAAPPSLLLEQTSQPNIIQQSLASPVPLSAASMLTFPIPQPDPGIQLQLQLLQQQQQQQAALAQTGNNNPGNIPIDVPDQLSNISISNIAPSLNSTGNQNVDLTTTTLGMGISSGMGINTVGNVNTGMGIDVSMMPAAQTATGVGNLGYGFPALKGGGANLVNPGSNNFNMGAQSQNIPSDTQASMDALIASLGDTSGLAATRTTSGTLQSLGNNNNLAGTTGNTGTNAGHDAGKNNINVNLAPSGQTMDANDPGGDLMMEFNPDDDFQFDFTAGLLDGEPDLSELVGLFPDDDGTGTGFGDDDMGNMANLSQMAIESGGMETLNNSSGTGNANTNTNTNTNTTGLPDLSVLPMSGTSQGMEQSQLSNQDQQIDQQQPQVPAQQLRNTQSSVNSNVAIDPVSITTSQPSSQPQPQPQAQSRPQPQPQSQTDIQSQGSLVLDSTNTNSYNDMPGIDMDDFNFGGGGSGGQEGNGDMFDMDLTLADDEFQTLMNTWK